MQRFVLACIIILFLIIFYILVRYLVIANYPAFRRLKKIKIKDDSFTPLSNNVSHFVFKLMDGKVRDKLLEKLYQCGYLYDGGTIEGFITLVISFVIIGVITFLLFLILSITFHTLFLSICGLFLLFMSVGFPFLVLMLNRSDYINNLVFQSPNFISNLEDEMVWGSGDILKALEIAEEESTSYLNHLIHDINVSARKDNLSISQILKMLDYRVNDKLFYQISLTLEIGHDTGRIEQMFQSLHQTAHYMIEEKIQQQTQKKSLMMTVVAAGIVLNFSILFGTAFLAMMQGIHLFSSFG